MKKLVIYYSLDGNTRFISKVIAGSIGADILELKPQADVNSKSFMKYFWGGRQVMTKQKPALFAYDKRPEDYDVLFIGTPVWAWTYAPSLSTFFDSVKLQGKKIALFCCSGGGKGKTLEKMKEQLTGNEFIGQIDFVEPLSRNKEENSKKAKEWAGRVLA